MSGTYTSDEKVEYALKTALFRTMQSKDQPSSVEKSAPPRIFPKNIMKKNLIEKGEGDIDEDGYYVGGTGSAYGSNDLANLEEPELTITNYRIIDPVSNKITNKRVSDLTTVNMSQTSHNSINALPTTGTNYPLKSWFFRGHYGSHSGEAAFNAANSSYDGLQLAWDKSTVGNTATEADIVPHLKFYLQVQTEYTNVAHGDNISYGHDLMKGLIGLDQNFSTTIQVVQGQGGSCVTLGETGTSTGDFWFTQATAGILSFYGVTNKVNASDALNGLSTTKFPMISFIRYVGETGFGAGSGGGGAAADPEQAVTEEPSWGNTNLDTIFYGNVGIGTTSPTELLTVGELTSDTGGTTSMSILAPGENADSILYFGTARSMDRAKKAAIIAEGTSTYSRCNLHFCLDDTADNSTTYNASLSNSRMIIKSNGKVGINTTSPGYTCHVNGSLFCYDALYSGTLHYYRGDTNTRRYWDANQMWWTCAGGTSSYEMWLKNGKVGIGMTTTDPLVADATYQLHLNGSSGGGICMYRANSTVGTLRIAVNSSQVFFGSFGSSTHSCDFYTNGTRRMRIKANGEISFGTSFDGQNGYGINFKDGFLVSNTSGYHLIHAQAGAAQYGIIDLKDMNSLTTRIKSRGDSYFNGGNVGIGTTSPNSKLEIHGGTLGLKNGNHTATTAQQILFGFSGVTNLEYAHSIRTRHNGQSSANDTQNSIDFYLWKKGDTTTTIGEKHGMSITAAGVGIGTTSPADKLHIAGGGGIQIDLNSTDYLKIDHNQIYRTNGDLFLNYQTQNHVIICGQGGNVGIGTTAPKGLLHIYGNSHQDAHSIDYAGLLRLSESSTNGHGHGLWGLINMPDSVASSSAAENYYMIGRGHQYSDNCLTLHVPTDGSIDMTSTGAVRMMKIQGNGNVGIGTTSPVVKLHVAPSAAFTNPSNFVTDGTYISDVYHKQGGSYSAYFAGHSTGGSSPYYSGWAGDYDQGAYEAANATSAYFEAGIMVGGRVWLESDERIKHGIEVINDSFALRTIREIECYTYFYNDMIRRTPEITLGFLAQEVREKFPMAVKMKQDFLPVAMTFAQDIIWEEIIDNSKNKFKLTIPILHKDASNNIVEHEPGTKFKFYLTDVSNNINNQDFCVSTLLEDGKSFILEKKSKYVFIYGYLVDDFHILDKEKIFTLHHSAIQEIDKIQQADKAEIAELKTEVATLKSELASVKQHLGI